MRKGIMLIVMSCMLCFLAACGEKEENLHMGTVEGAEQNVQEAQEVDTSEEVSYSKGNGKISITLLEGWEHEIESADDSKNFAIKIWPEEETEGKLSIEYHDNLFGVCGTGLKEEKIKIGQYDALKGTYEYDNPKDWNFISIMNVEWKYVILNEEADSWLSEYEDEVFEMLDTLHVKS